ncbi:MAG: AMP-binding protein [Acidimicrobiia bacterium]|nr:AMP-binding protein [Acidimicrobiia bacterium]
MNRLDLSDRRERVLGRLLARQAEAIADTPFMVAGDDVDTFGRVDELARAYAAGLAALGVGQGDTVAMLMDGGPEVVIAAFAANKLGAIWVPTNTDYRGGWLAEALRASRAKVLLADGDLVERVAQLDTAVAFDHVVTRGEAATALDGAAAHCFEEIAVAGAGEPDVDIHYGDTSAVMWTSGTTGRSKGVEQSHNCWVFGSEEGIRNADIRAGDVLYSCMPLYNTGAWVTVIYRSLLCGVPFGLDRQFSAAEFWNRTRHYGATHTFTLGAMHIYLWQAPPRPDDADNPVRVAAAIPMPENLIAPFKERFGIEQLFQGYGQSEMLGVMSRVDDGTTEWGPNSSGRANDSVDLALLDDDDNPVATGDVGEICVRPKEPFALFNGYFHDPAATLAAFRNLWYHTGDLARCDDNGHYYFVDRKADYIRHKGRSISSFQVEATVNAHPDVVQSAAFGIEAELESEAEIKVDVVLAPGATLTPEELCRFVNEHAPYFAVPRYVEFVTELPQTPNGRVRKFELRARGLTDGTWDRNASDFELVR